MIDEATEIATVGRMLDETERAVLDGLVTIAAENGWPLEARDLIEPACTLTLGLVLAGVIPRDDD